MPSGGANPANYLSTKELKSSIDTLKEIDKGRLYTLDYSSDYRLDEVASSGIYDAEPFIEYMQELFLSGDVIGSVIPEGGCSSFAVNSSCGVLVGRNQDCWQNMTAVLVHTAPENGYESIGLANMGNIGFGEGSLSDKTTDISALAIAPYLVLDGVNEAGFSVTIMSLDEPIRQDTGKTKLGTTVAIRLLLDRASSVKEAIELLSGYDISSADPNHGEHFLIADASGNAAVLEFNSDGIVVLKKRTATNFALDPDSNGAGSGQDRQAILDSVLEYNMFRLEPNDAMTLLSFVAQNGLTGSPSETKWSALYDLEKKSVSIALEREYDNIYDFSLDDFK